MVTDLLGGQVQAAFDALPTSIEHIRAGRLRALAVTTVRRSQALPDVPTMSEFLPGFEASGWIGVGAPSGTPPEIIDKLNQEINVGLANPTINERIADLGGEAFTGSPADLAKFVVEKTEAWAKVVRAANIRAEWNRLKFLAGKRTYRTIWKNTRSDFGETAARRSLSLRPEIEKKHAATG
jgi:tripartite-type tricarboxylate transporter receptor subunit TctC